MEGGNAENNIAAKRAVYLVVKELVKGTHINEGSALFQVKGSESAMSGRRVHTGNKQEGSDEF